MKSSATLPPLCPTQTRRVLNLAPGGVVGGWVVGAGRGTPEREGPGVLKLTLWSFPLVLGPWPPRSSCASQQAFPFPGSWRSDVPLVFHVSQCVSVYTVTCDLAWYINIISFNSFSEQSVVVDRQIRQLGFKNKVVVPHLLPKKVYGLLCPQHGLRE